MGGSIGNSIFFWVSGFCLSNIKSRGSIVVDGGLGICTDCGDVRI